MRMPAYLAALFLSLFLTACGGGGDPVVSDSSTGTGDTDTSGSDTDDVTTSSVIDTPSIGTGFGDAYQSGVLSVNTTSLSAGGSTQITATIVDSGNNNKKIASEEYTVLFNSSCATDGRAEFSKPEVTTSSGDVTVTYTAKGCSGDDFITFGLYPSGTTGAGDRLAVASGSITVAPPEVGAITYIGVDAPLISISTIGDAVLPKLTTVTFKVVDTANNPIVNQTVDFELSNTMGGLSLSIESSVTNDAGEVSTVVLAGSTHTDAVVRATTFATDGTTKIFTSSQNISVTTGIADQDSFVIALDKYSTWGWDTFGEPSEVAVTAFVNDHFQNPVPDGTVVNFVADAGHIQSACLTANGSCEVVWYSTAPLPGSDEAGNVYTADNVRDRAANVTYDANWNGGLPGIATITAYTSGEAGFSDSDGDNLFDVGESFESYAEAFLDANENGIYDHDSDRNPREQFFDYNGDGNFTSAPSEYQGVSCEERDGIHCQSLMHVRDSKRFIVASADTNVEITLLEGFSASSTPMTRDLSNESCVIVKPDEQIKINYLLSDVNGNMPPAGTSFSFDSDGLFELVTVEGDVGAGDFGSDGFALTYVVSGDPDDSLTKFASPSLTVEEVDGSTRSRGTPPRFTDNFGVVVEVDQLPVTAGTTFNLSFVDACGSVITDDIGVFAELSNANFASGAATSQRFIVTTGSLALDLITDGAGSYDEAGLKLIVFREGQLTSTELELPVADF
jgi:hypothetical protein